MTAEDPSDDVGNNWGNSWEASTNHPSRKPTRKPHKVETSSPSEVPTFKPTSKPTSKPTNHPTSSPTSEPSTLPTFKPTSQPTFNPTSQPTFNPTSQPTFNPTATPTSTPTAQPTSDPTIQPSTQPVFQPSRKPSVYPSATPTFGPTQYVTHITAAFTIYDAATVGNYSFYLVQTPNGPQIRVTDCGVSRSCGNPQTSIPIQGVSDKLNRTLTYFSMAIDLTAICLYASDEHLYFIEGEFTSFGGNYTFNSAFENFNQSNFPFPGVTSLGFLPSGNVSIGINYTMSSGLPPWINASPVQLFSN